jgi:hypothetical protein
MRVIVKVRMSKKIVRVIWVIVQCEHGDGASTDRCSSSSS